MPASLAVASLGERICNATRINVEILEGEKHAILAGGGEVGEGEGEGVGLGPPLSSSLVDADS